MKTRLIIRLAALCLVVTLALMVRPALAANLAIRGYFGTNGVPLLYMQTSVGLNSTQSGQYLSLYNGKMNTSTRYSPPGSVSQVDTGTVIVVTARTWGYGYSLPYGAYTVPSDLVWVYYTMTIPKDSRVKPTVSITVSSYDHPTLPAFYHADLVLVSGGTVILP